MSQQSTIRSPFLWLVPLFLAAGCGQINQQPFNEWKDATATLAIGANAAIKEVADAPKERALQEIQDDPTKLTVLKLGKSEVDDFGFQSAERTEDGKSAPLPLFMSSQRFAVGVEQLNTAMREYAIVLAALASSDLIDTAQLDKLAGEVNVHAVAASEAFGADEPARGTIALFTTGARELAKQYLHSRQRRDLLGVIDSSQPKVEDLSTLGISAIAIATDSRWNEYDRKSQAILDQLINRDPNAPPAEIDENQAREVAQALIALNEEHTAALEVLRELREAYRQLPRAHAELRQAAADTSIQLDDLQRLVEQGLALRKLYEGLKEDPSGEAAAPAQ